MYMQYADQLYGFAFKLTRSSDEAEDILQETFMRIWLNREKITTDSSFKSYLFQISYHLVIDSFRKKLEAVDFENYIRNELSAETESNNTGIQLILEDYQKQIRQSISRLTPQQQKIFHLRREKQLSSKDVGRLLNISEKTVNNQLSLILSILKTDLLLFVCFMLFNT